MWRNYYNMIRLITKRLNDDGLFLDRYGYKTYFEFSENGDFPFHIKMTAYKKRLQV